MVRRQRQGADSLQWLYIMCQWVKEYQQDIEGQTRTGSENSLYKEILSASEIICLSV